MEIKHKIKRLSLKAKQTKKVMLIGILTGVLFFSYGAILNIMMINLAGSFLIFVGLYAHLLLKTYSYRLERLKIIRRSLNENSRKNRN